MKAINMSICDEYAARLRSLNPIDRSVDSDNILWILNGIYGGKSLEYIFHSKMMFYSVCLTLRMLYLDELIQFENTQNNFIAQFTTNNIILDNHIDSLHLIDSSFSNEKIDRACRLIKERSFLPSIEYFQNFSSLDSLKRRFKTMSHFDDLKGKSVIFLGADDLYILFYALNSKSEKISVVDIDGRILQYIKKVGIEYNLNIETYECDIMEKFPEELVSKFDLFFVNGFKDLGGLLTFICTGLLSLKDGYKGSGYFAYYDYEKSINKELTGKIPYEYKLQEYLIKMNCFIDCIVPCDETELSSNSVRRAVEIITSRKEEKLDTDYLEWMKNELKPLAGHPLFPLFSLRPIKLARITQNGIPTDFHSKMLYTLKGFNIKIREDLHHHEV